MGCTSIPVRARALILVACGVFAAMAAHAGSAGYTVAKLAFEGDADPVQGTLNQMIGEVELDESGRVAFVSYVEDGGAGATKIFEIENGGLAVAVTTGGAAPDTGGLLFTDVGRSRIAAPGVLAYFGLYDDAGDSKGGVFLRDGGAHSAVALEGTSAPGGGAITRLLYVHDATAAAAVAFAAVVDGETPSEAFVHFVHSGAGLREIYRDGAAAPAAVGGNYSGVQAWWIPSLNADGTATFFSYLAGGSVASGFFQSSPTGTVTPVLLAGDPVTTPGGGTFESFSQMVGANGDGDIVFLAFVLRPPLLFAPQAIFVLESGVQREIVFRGDPIPGTNPARFFAQLAGSGPPAFNRAGSVAFVASLTDEFEIAWERALLVERGGELAIIAREGDPVPGLPGATFTDFLEVAIADDDTIAFYGYTTAGNGVFLATPPASVVAVPRFGLALLGVGLTAAAAMVGRRPKPV
jgi:hypothetical protein